MTKPIERAAKAIEMLQLAQTIGNKPSAAEQTARAALASLSPPTQAMIDAGLKAAGHGAGHEAEISRMDLEDAFNAMIEESLK